MPVRFYFGAISPYSWFAAERIGELIPQAVWRPVFAGGLFRSVGRTSWGLTPEREEGLEDCRRRAAAHGLGEIRWPEGWPGNDVLSSRAILAAGHEGKLVPFALAAMRACFREGLDITQADVLVSAADAVGLDGTRLLDHAATPAIKDELRAITDQAVAARVIGVPSVVVRSEVFWGDDRLHEAAEAVTRQTV
jgi:2-hydroxychromene-2-carboxylate isomerase